MLDPLTKRDDQTMVTIGKIANYNVKYGRSTALRATYDNAVLGETIKNAWAQMENPNPTKQDLFELFNDSSKVDHSNPYIRVMCHMLNRTALKHTPVDYKSTPDKNIV